MDWSGNNFTATTFCQVFSSSLGDFYKKPINPTEREQYRPHEWSQLAQQSSYRAFLRNTRLNGANLAGVALRAADLTDVEFEQLESIAGADFTQVQGLIQEMRSRLLSQPIQELKRSIL